MTIGRKAAGGPSFAVYYDLIRQNISRPGTVASTRVSVFVHISRLSGGIAGCLT